MKIEDNRTKCICDFDKLAKGTVFESEGRRYYIKCRTCCSDDIREINAVALLTGDPVHFEKHDKVVPLENAKVVIE